LKTLNTKEIDLKKLQRLAFKGIPDEIKGLRPIVWKVLLNHLPLQTALWEDHLEKSHKTYEAWRHELIIKPSVKDAEEKAEQIK